MKHTQNMTERAARAEALLDRAVKCIEEMHEHHTCAICGDEARAFLAAHAAHKDDLDTLVLNAAPDIAREG